MSPRATPVRHKLQKTFNIKIKIHPDIKYLGIGKCWYIRDDWSQYTTIKGKIAHRLVYEFVYGPIKPGMSICHKCDRPGCIRPEHLFQGTAKDNSIDSVEKGRAVTPFNLRLGLRRWQWALYPKKIS